MDQHPIQGGVEILLVTQSYRNWVKIWLCEPLDWRRSTLCIHMRSGTYIIKPSGGRSSPKPIASLSISPTSLSFKTLKNKVNTTVILGFSFASVSNRVQMVNHSNENIQCLIEWKWRMRLYLQKGIVPILLQKEQEALPGTSSLPSFQPAFQSKR